MLINFSLVSKTAIPRDCVHSTFKNTVDYYRCRGSHVFVCFIDFSTAFDTVNYWKLFSKLFIIIIFFIEN